MKLRENIGWLVAFLSVYPKNGGKNTCRIIQKHSNNMFSLFDTRKEIFQTKPLKRIHATTFTFSEYHLNSLTQTKNTFSLVLYMRPI